MAQPPIPDPENSAAAKSVDSQIAEVDGGVQADEAPAPAEIYRLDTATKVPVSRYEGPMWESRKKAGLKMIEQLSIGWEEAEYYYNNSQQNHRKETTGNRAGNRNYGKDRRDSFSMTENWVYATVNAVIPNIYAKNPTVEVTMVDEQQERVGVMLKHLMNQLAEMKYTPGLNLKPKVKKSIMRTEITNESYIMVGWTRKDDSADQARMDIQRIGSELVDAKDAKEIERLEGELMALEESVDLLDPAGPFVRTVRGKDVVWDTASCEDDHSDANHCMVKTSFSTNYLNAKYRIKNEDGTYANAYKPTHVVDSTATTTTEAAQEQVDNFKMFDSNQDNPQDYGYSDKRSYQRAKRTDVWLCFDKVKRRFYMYADNDWTWPIWVFDDPYKLPNFYPLHKLVWHTDPTMNRSRGEVSHYLDQQDEINTIVDEGNRLRVLLRDNLLFDSNTMTNKDVEDIVLNANKKIKGIKIPDGKKVDDVIFSPPTPTLKFEHLWDKSSASSAINRISGVGDAMRGEQFKTNTTNQAIQEYSSVSGTRLDEKRDAVEDFIGGIMSDVLFMWLQFADADTTLGLVGQSYANEVQMLQLGSIDAKTIRSMLHCSIEGGSTQKPTSAAKKAEALQVGQVLGQFASASPYITVILLKVFQRAFDGIVVTETDMQMVIQSVQQQLQQGAPAQQGQQQGQGEGQDDEAKEQQMLEEMVAKGVPKEVAIQKIQQMKQGTQGNTQ